MRAESNPGRLLFVSLVSVPFFLGLGMAPGLIRTAFAALAAKGLDHPEFIGAGAGEAFAPAALGLLLGLGLLLAFIALLRGSPEPRRSDLPAD